METFPENPFETVKARMMRNRWLGSRGAGGVRMMQTTE